MKRLVLFCLFIALNVCLQAQNIHISLTGSDSNSGNELNPLKTINTALTKIQPGDTIYIHEGHYLPSAVVSISKNGTEQKRYYLMAYKNESVILDFKNTTFGTRAISLKSNYWVIKNIKIQNSGDNAIFVSGSYNIIDNCSFCYNQDTGLQLSSGASKNSIINCDSYLNSDPQEGNADGFAAKLDVGTDNYFYGCRAWLNSDDGWDGYLRGSNNISTILENCWTFQNGFRKDGKTSNGNGNGFKMGGSDDKLLKHNITLKNCIAFDNRVKGFDQNNNKGSIILYNCSSFRNGINYGIPANADTGKSITIINCLSFKSVDQIVSTSIQKTNSWNYPVVMNENEFISTDTTGAILQRDRAGNLILKNFLQLSQNSFMIDKGTDVGLPYNGKAPDIGAFESNYITSVSINSESVKLTDNFIIYPNPLVSSKNGSAYLTILYQLPEDNQKAERKIKIEIYSILGEKIETLTESYQSTGIYEIKYNFNNQSSGNYLVLLKVNNKIYHKKLVYIK